MESISKCEEEVFLSIFRLSHDDAALQQVMGTVNEKFKHEWKPQTVSTFLTRLIKKGYLRMERKGRYCYYYPLVSLEEYRAEKMRSMVELLFDGDQKKVEECLKSI